jgi:hypothetical protein
MTVSDGQGGPMFRGGLGGCASSELVHRVDQAPEPAEVPAVEVHHEAGQVSKLLIVGFLGQGTGEADLFRMNQDILKTLAQFADPV